MKLFRTFNSRFDPSQPPIQWEGDVRGIIAARRAQEAAQMNRLRLRMIQRPTLIPQPEKVRTEVLLEVAA
jgi:hypothetical protein